MVMGIKQIFIDFFAAISSLSYWKKYFLLIAVSFACYFPLFSGYVLTHDEQWTLLMVGKPLKEMIHIIASDDGSPPLYYLYQRLWYVLDAGSYNVFWVRVANFAVLIMTTLLGVFPIRRLYGDRISLLFCLLVFIMPSSQYLVTDIRGYALSGMLILGVMVYALSIVNRKNNSDWFWLFLFTELGIYNHYYCGLWDILIWFCLFVILVKQQEYKSIGKMLLCGILVSLFYFPWLVIFVEQYADMKAAWYPKLIDVENAGWAFFFCFQDIHTFYVILACYLWTLILEFWVEKRVKMTEKTTVRMFLSVCFLFYVISVLISIFMRPVLVGRYIYMFAPMFFLCSAIALLYFRKYLKLLPLVMLPAFICSYQTKYDEMQNKAWENLREYAAKNISANSLIIVNYTWEHIATRFYLPEYKYAYAPIEKTLVLLQDEVKENQKNLKNLNEYDEIYYYRTTYKKGAHQPDVSCQFIVAPSRQAIGCLSKITPDVAEKILQRGTVMLEESYH